MNVKRLTFLVFAFLLCTVASAQSYSVRVTHNTNLRASYSLDARIVDSAAAGTTLTVTGSRDMWLMIDRSGREVWMADWVPMTRVEGGPVSADINNCCFVDRQCNSDHEWTAGYWAFQNNQCGAPIAPVSNAPTAISTEDASEANNCCVLGWNCQSDHQWEQGFWNYQYGQCEHPGVFIDGSEGFKSTIDDALKLLRDRAPQWYPYTLEGLNKIREVAGTTIWVYWPGGENIWGRDGWALTSRNLVRIAASLTHEACHVHRSRSGQEPGGVVGERACTLVESQALAALGASAETVRHEQNLAANVEKPECQWWHDQNTPGLPDHCYE